MKDAQREEHFEDILSNKYLTYALSTIMSRSLPDVRDGLKPVHRRLLYAMRELNLDPKSGYKKCARIIGDVIGKYHPHSDVAVYDTLVRLAQSFSLRYPLIEGQGNFGSIDGDAAAAMRYTESKLTHIACLLMEDLDNDTVDFKPNYDEIDKEPVILPAAFPNIIVNGSEGIAVGMATNIPPHNLHEICDALIYIIKEANYLKGKNPEEEFHKQFDHIKDENLTDFVKGPDFPTGGSIVINEKELKNIYLTGKGYIRLRANFYIENNDIIITAIPYQTQKSKIILKIAESLKNKEFAFISDVRDESAEDIRMVIEPKSKDTDPNFIMAMLFKHTDLETRIHVNMNVLSSKMIPKVMNLKEILLEFLQFRYQTICRRENFKLKQMNDRLEILEGLNIVYLNLDEVIRIIRREDNSKAILMEKFSLNETQVNSILNLRLKSLYKLEEFAIKKEYEELGKAKAKILDILSKPYKIFQIIESELLKIQKEFGYDSLLGKRKTSFVEDLGEFKETIIVEPVTIHLTKNSWVYNIKGQDNTEIKHKTNDEDRFIIKAFNSDKVIIFTNYGKFYTLIIGNIPQKQGESIRLIFDFVSNEEVLNVFVYEPEQDLIILAENAKGFKIKQQDAIAQTKIGKQSLILGENTLAFACINTKEDKLALIGSNRKLLVIDVKDIPFMRKSKGVTLQKYDLTTKLEDVQAFKSVEGLRWQADDSTIHYEKNITSWKGKIGAKGKIPPLGFSKRNKFSN